MTAAVDTYSCALLSRGARVEPRSWWVRDATGDVRALDREIDRWLGPCDDADASVVERCLGPALDIGCGPGRIAAELGRAGLSAVGVDISELAVRLARRNGAVAMQGDVFAPLPGEGGWRSVLLIDGNIGIGGDPARLLRRCAELLRSDGCILVEVAPPGQSADAMRLRLESAGTVGPWFPWAQVGVDSVDGVARRAGLVVTETWNRGDRWFGSLTR